MQRAMTGLSGVLLALVVWLAVLVWRQSHERENWQMESDTRTKRLTELRTQVTGWKARAGSADANAKPPTATDPKSAAILREWTKLAADREQARFRRNALNGYIAGFDTLNLPPEMHARAKEIILASWKAVEEAGTNARSREEFEAAVALESRAEKERLIALLGQEA